MQVTIDELLQGKPTKIKNKDYFPTKGYVEPFLERMSKITNDFRVDVKLPDQITVADDGENDITYNRVLVQAVLPDIADNHSSVIGMVYGLDVRKPIVKIYKGLLNHACTNLCVFDPSFLNVQFIEPEKAINFKPVDYLIEREDDTRLMLDTLSNTTWDGTPTNIESNLGRWIRKSLASEYENGYGKIKIGTDLVIKAYQDIFVNEDSSYFIGENKPVDMFTVYNSFTQQLTNAIGKDMMNICEKTILLRQILDF